MTVVRLATRTSPLAVVQARRVAAMFEALGGVSTEIVLVETGADRRLDVPIRDLGGEGVFVAEVEVAVLEDRADVAVHSAKDLPSGAPIEGLVLAAIPERIDPRDALVGAKLDALGPGAIVATGAVRRRAQLAWIRPDLCFAELRGNIETRLGKVPEGGAAVVAYAALIRLGLTGREAEVLPITTMLPQVGQGALALRCREDDQATRERCAAIDDVAISRAVNAERAFLAALGGGCDAPVGAYATTDGVDATLQLEALIARDDGHAMVRGTLEGTNPEAVGSELARWLLDDAGGRTMLADAASP